MFTSVYTLHLLSNHITSTSVKGKQFCCFDLFCFIFLHFYYLYYLKSRVFRSLSFNLTCLPNTQYVFQRPPSVALSFYSALCRIFIFSFIYHICVRFCFTVFSFQILFFIQFSLSKLLLHNVCFTRSNMISCYFHAQ